ncbi:MAG: ATP-binding cassette domain-containing protein, partial [Burkholderiales bacterium]
MTQRDDQHAGSGEASPGVSRIVLEVEGLRAGYGRVPVLHGVSFRLHEGEALGIVGHNGMGKSTLLKTIMGLLPATAGRIALDGVDVTREPPYTRSR